MNCKTSICTEFILIRTLQRSRSSIQINLTMKKRTFNSAQEVDDHQESEPVMKRARLQENGEIQSSSGRPTEYGNASKTQAEEQQKRANLDRRPREKQHRNKEAADILRNQHKIQVPAPREVCSSRRSAVCGSGNSSTVNTI